MSERDPTCVGSVDTVLSIALGLVVTPFKGAAIGLAVNNGSSLGSTPLIVGSSVLLDEGALTGFEVCCCWTRKGRGDGTESFLTGAS